MIDRRPALVCRNVAEINKEAGINGVGGESGDGAANTRASGVAEASVAPPKASEGDHVVNADKYFTPFQLACQSKSPKIVRTALDSLQKLMAYGHLTGRMLSAVDGFPDAIRLVDLIVDTVW